MKLFRTVKEIRSKEGHLHFKRFAIVECKYFNIYIHTILRKDDDIHLHDHPWDYLSIVLAGEFLEQYEKDGKLELAAMDLGSISRQKAERFHKLKELGTYRVVTLFFTGPRKRDWGYNVDGKWVDNITYRKNKRSGYYS